METLTFVLGALSGLFLIGMVYTFIGVLKMSTQIKNQREEIETLHRRIDEVQDKSWLDLEKQSEENERQMNHLANEINHRSEDHERNIDKLAEEINHKSDETHRYIDSRLDKAIDALCMRMDEIMKSSGTKTVYAEQTHLSK